MEYIDWKKAMFNWNTFKTNDHSKERLHKREHVLYNLHDAITEQDTSEAHISLRMMDAQWCYVRNKKIYPLMNVSLDVTFKIVSQDAILRAHDSVYKLTYQGKELSSVLRSDGDVEIILA